MGLTISGVGRPGLKGSMAYHFHALTGVATECRPFGPKSSENRGLTLYGLSPKRPKRSLIRTSFRVTCKTRFSDATGLSRGYSRWPATKGWHE
jgi:hypothetical protein